MQRHFPTLVCFLVLAALAAAGCSSGSGDSSIPPDPGGPIELREGWAVRSSAEVPESGDVIASGEIETAGWVPATVPSTLVAALVAAGVYPDPYYGMNLHDIPTSWPPPFDVSNAPMPPKSPFASSWWYRTTFTAPAGYAGKAAWLRFGGINFRAEIWFNGERIADKQAVAGPFREYEFDVTAAIRPGQPNFLAVEVFAPGLGDLATNWVDWGPMPPDRNMGLIGPVVLSASGPVALRHPQVISRLDLPSMEEAHLTVTVEATNATGERVAGILRGRIEDLTFVAQVALDPHETRLVEVSHSAYPQLNLSHPRVWWPVRLGAQNLYECDLSFEIAGRLSDATSLRFGIREVSSELTEEGFRLFRVNGRKILIRGGAWSPDILLRPSAERDEADVRYALDMNLNAIRLEGKPVSERFLNLCDELGIFILAGWCCCDHWENWWSWDDEDYKVSAASLETQALAMRNHPSVLAWLNGSDGIPPPKVEAMYDDVLAAKRWPNVILSTSKQHVSKLTGPSGVKMTGPYEYTPPEYWLADTERGGAFGFNTETGPGPAVPPVESLERFLPPEHRWPIDSFWTYHAGRGFYMQLDVFTRGIDERYGPATGIEDYARKAQVIAYDNHRAMFEAYGRNKYHATGVVQWMMNNGWPCLIWHLYDYYLRPAGAYFGAKKGCEPLHVQYSYDDRSIVVVNSLFQAFPGMTVQARVYDFHLTERLSREAKVDVEPDASIRVFSLPEIADLTTTYFVKLVLKDDAGKVVSENFYWLSTKPTEIDWAHGGPLYTPTKSDADMKMLATFPRVALEVTQQNEPATGTGETVRVRVRNPASTLAFAVELRLTQGPGGADVVPIYWQDNYITLLPGEEREIAASFPIAALEGKTPTVVVGTMGGSSGR